MDLILTVVADPQGANMRNHTKVFDQGGGTFGRSEDNTWVLPDPERVVSSRHASIIFESGQFHVVDTSTNGTFLNDGTAALKKGGKQVLAEGDVLVIGEYKLKVSVRKPEVKSPKLPKGLQAVDFLDGADKTRMGDTNFNQTESGAAEFDSWLEPGASAQKEDSWGFLNDTSTGNESGLKPAAGASINDFVTSADVTGNNLDPLAPLTGDVGGLQKNWEEDDDWWKAGSTGDNSSPDQQHISVQPRIPVPPVAPPPVAPAVVAPPIPVAPAQPAPPPVAAPVVAPPAEDNPFAASAALVQGQPLPSGLGGDTPPSSFPPSSFAPPAPAVAPIQAPPASPVAPPDWGQPPAAAPVSPPSAPPIAPPISPAPPAAPAANVSGRAVADAQALAQSLGLSALPAEQLQKLLPEASAIIEETVNRLIDLMRARTSVKNELRVQRTMIQIQDNNPLKFSASGSDAMHALFGGANTAYMAPQDAVRDSFDDLSDHQVAVLSGMRAAYEYMLQQFAPPTLERRLNTGGSHLVLSKSAKKWDAFEKYFEELKRDPETSYRRLFGEEFANAYEQQLSELKNARAIGRRGS